YVPVTTSRYTLKDKDFVPNQATNPRSVSAMENLDPVIVTRTDPTLEPNDIQLEYLDRTTSYNPQVLEIQDEASVNQYDIKTAPKRQLHMFCDRGAALTSAQLQLGRMQQIVTVVF